MRSLADRCLVLAVVLPLVVGLGCGHAPPKPPPPAERAANTAADLAGDWVTSDDFDWGYRLHVAADGDFLLTIDRGKMGRCEQHGKLAAKADHLLTLALSHDTCTAANATAPSELHVTSFTTEVLAISLAADGATESRTYKRAPVNQPLVR